VIISAVVKMNIYLRRDIQIWRNIFELYEKSIPHFRRWRQKVLENQSVQIGVCVKFSDACEAVAQAPHAGEF
jgi:hypothetical protein